MLAPWKKSCDKPRLHILGAALLYAGGHLNIWERLSCGRHLKNQGNQHRCCYFLETSGLTKILWVPWEASVSSFDHTMVKMEIFEDMKKKKSCGNFLSLHSWGWFVVSKLQMHPSGLMAAHMPYGKSFTLRCVKYTNPARVKICTL